MIRDKKRGCSAEGEVLETSLLLFEVMKVGFVWIFLVCFPKESRKSEAPDGEMIPPDCTTDTPCFCCLSGMLRGQKERTNRTESGSGRALTANTPFNTCVLSCITVCRACSCLHT